MLLVSNLKVRDKYFLSMKTQKKGNEWVFDLDTCLVNPLMVSKMSQFSTIRNELLPSDHAPSTVSFTLPWGPGSALQHPDFK